MRSVITQSVVLPAPAPELFEMYLDPEGHGALTGSPVEIGREPGAAFSAFDGVLRGEILAVVPSTLVVQSWRSTAFHEGDPDSTLVLSFVADGANGRIDLVHLDVPAHDHAGVTAGWPAYYWHPWRRFLEARG